MTRRQLAAAERYLGLGVRAAALLRAFVAGGGAGVSLQRPKGLAQLWLLLLEGALSRVGRVDVAATGGALGLVGLAGGGGGGVVQAVLLLLLLLLGGGGGEEGVHRRVAALAPQAGLPALLLQVPNGAQIIEGRGSLYAGTHACMKGTWCCQRKWASRQAMLWMQCTAAARATMLQQCHEPIQGSGLVAQQDDLVSTIGVLTPVCYRATQKSRCTC